MADFKNGYSTTTICNYDSTEGTLQTTATPINCDFAILFTTLSAIDFGRAVYLMASNSENFYLECVSTAQDNHGGSDTTTARFGEVTGASTNPYVTRDNNGGDLLDLANDYKDLYFGGVTQTAASLKAWLDNRYGEHLYYFSGLGLAPISQWLSGANPGYRRNITLTADVTAPLYDEPSFNPSEQTNPSWSLSGDSIVYPSTIPPSSSQADDKPAFRAWWIFEERNERNELQFDVYVDGTQDPNIAITWQANERENDFSLQLVSPMIWTLPDSQPSYPYINDGGVLIPNEANAQMRKYANTWAGSYQKPYLTEFNACTDTLDTFDKTLKYGAGGIATRMRYLLRFNKQKNENNTGVMTWGNLYIVDVPREVSTVADINVTRLDPSTNNPEFSDSVVVHLGAPPDDIPDADDDYPTGEDFDGTGDGVYEDDDIHDFDDGTPTGFDGKAILTKTYAMTAAKTANVGSKLWSQSYFDVLKIQNNPIENIVAMKWFPFSVSGTQGNIKVGDIDFGLQTDVVDTMYRFTVGSAWYRPRESRASFLDCSPYTQIKLHLPYCGIVQLDATELLNRRITVKYVVDLVSGDCIAFIYLDGNELGEKQIPYMSVEGHCGVDIPLTASNRIQAEMRAASTAISAMTGAAGHVLAGDVGGAVSEAAQGALNIAGMDFTTQRTKAHSPACMSYENRNCYLEIWRPATDSELTSNDGFKSRHGFPCYKYKTLSELSGFVKCDARTKIDFAMTSRENEMLERLLTSGVYV